MSYFQFFAYLFTDIFATITSVLIGVTVFYLSKFYLQLWSLPPGPLPIPVLGNLLLFRGSKVHQVYDLEKLSKKYGSVFTLWMGPKPYVFIMDLELGKDAFSRNEIAGRADSVFGKIVCNDKFNDIIFNDYGPAWITLRRVAHLAVRKYSTTDKLSYLVRDCVEHSVQAILEREGPDKPFMPFHYVYHMFLNIMATSVFGKRYDLEDPEFKKLNYIFHEFFVENTVRYTLIEFLPIMQYLDRNMVKKREDFMCDTREMVKKKYRSHFEDFNESSLRDLCDALIAAKNEALIEGKETAHYLNDNNLSMVLWDLVIGGVDTTHNTFKWMILLMASDHNIQKRLREEIASEIGDRIPVHSDREQCHYAMAFISETLRYRHVVPLGLFHKTLTNSGIGEHYIPKGTGIFLNHYHILNDEKHWSQPDQFIPERFLNDSKYEPQKHSAFIPFGIGRRICLGEKMAIIELFLILVNFLQLTVEYRIDLTCKPDFEPNPAMSDSLRPKEFEIIFHKRIDSTI